MKKVMGTFIIIIAALILGACARMDADENMGTSGKTEASTQLNTETAASTPIEKNTEAPERISNAENALIVYFSWSSEGNTVSMANTVQEYTGADVLRLEPVVAYPADYNDCGEIAKVERDENARPAIQNLPTDLAKYDTIFVGYPIWWHTAPMIIGTFLESYDLTGKEIYPFAQSASMDEEQFANSMTFVRDCAEGANVHDGLFVRASDTNGILAYLTENGFIE